VDDLGAPLSALAGPAAASFDKGEAQINAIPSLSGLSRRARPKILQAGNGMSLAASDLSCYDGSAIATVVGGGDVWKWQSNGMH
jgi:hypothetical protein